MTAPMKLVKSHGSPTLISAICFSISFLTRGQIEVGMNARDAAEHF